MAVGSSVSHSCLIPHLRLHHVDTDASMDSELFFQNGQPAPTLSGLVEVHVVQE